jgi:ferredoxin
VDDRKVQSYWVDPTRCIRCGVSMSVAPTLFDVGDAHARLVRQPTTPEDIQLAELAMDACPVQAVRRTVAPDGG